MELRQLRYLVALDQELNFTRAAAREHIAQPALSQQIQRLEAEVGLTLVERTTRAVRMTDAGRLLVARAGRIIAELDDARAELLALRGVETGHVFIGSMHTMGPIDVSLALGAFHERHPYVELTVHEESSGDLAEMLRTDQIDLAFLSVTERVERHELGLQQLIAEDLVVVLPPDHRFAGRRTIQMKSLRNERFITFRSGSRLRELLLSASAAAGFTPSIALESNESRRIRRLVSRGMGVALLPHSDATESGPDVAVLTPAGESLHRDISLAWREDRKLSPAAAAFRETALEIFLPMGGDGLEPPTSSL